MSSTASSIRLAISLSLRHRGRPLQAHPDGEQRLDHAVVELLRDPLAIFEHLEPRELLLRALHLLVQPGVLDRDTGLGGQHDAAPPRRPRRTRARPASRSGRCCRTRCPRARTGAPRNECIGGWFGGNPTERGSARDVGDAQRPRLLDQQPEHAVPGRRVADRGALLVGDAVGDELVDAPVLAEHAERPVPRAGDLDGELDDPLQDARRGRARRRVRAPPRSASAPLLGGGEVSGGHHRRSVARGLSAGAGASDPGTGSVGPQTPGRQPRSKAGPGPTVLVEAPRWRQGGGGDGPHRS